jgi:hypothetical protein
MWMWTAWASVRCVSDAPPEGSSAPAPHLVSSTPTVGARARQVPPTRASGTVGTPTTPTGAGGALAACDDGLACSIDTRDGWGRCIATAVTDCEWPASPAPGTSLAGLVPGGELHVSLSGATWNAETRGLWLVRNTGPSAIWEFVENRLGDLVLATADDGVPAEWYGLGDAESLTFVDPVNHPTVAHVLDEDRGIIAYDLADHGAPVELDAWELSEWLPDDGSLGAEGLAFVPDGVLADWHFVDGAGWPRISALGMGGLMFVGHQNGGRIYVFDLADGGRVEHVGTFDTARDETSGLELDGATGRLYVWHGGAANDLEVVRLSSTDVGAANRRFDTEYVFDHLGTGNLEGVALLGVEDCSGGGRPMILVEDDGGDDSAQLYPDWPLGCP